MVVSQPESFKNTLLNTCLKMPSGFRIICKMYQEVLLARKKLFKVFRKFLNASSSSSEKVMLQAFIAILWLW